MFVEKFCFVSTGKIEMKLNYSTNFQPQNLLLYYDDQWPKVYPSKMVNLRLNLLLKINYS